MSDPVAPEVVDHVRALVGAVPGVTLRSAIWLDPGSSASRSENILRVEADGWSPALHGRERRWQVDCTMTGPFSRPIRIRRSGDDLLDGISLGLARGLHAQALLADVAAAHGIDSPMPRPSRPSLEDMAHVRIERAAVDAYATLFGGITDPLSRIADLFENCAMDASLDLEQRRSAGDDELGGKVHVVDGHVLLGMRFDLGGRVFVDDNMVEFVRRPLPATTYEAMTGRPLGHAVATGRPGLDARVVTRVHDHGAAGFTAELERDLVAIPDHPTLIPWHGALARLPRRPV